MKPLRKVVPEAIMNRYRYLKEEKEENEMEAKRALSDFKATMQNPKRMFSKFELEALRKNKRILSSKRYKHIC